VVNLWSKPENEVDLNYIQRLVDLYSLLIREFYPMANHTINMHQFSKHLIESYQNHGMFCLNNGFLFEHLNNIPNNQTTSGFGILEQIAEKSQLLFRSNIEKSTIKSKNFKTNSKSNIKKVSNDFTTLKTSKSRSETKDFYVMTHDNRFYKILKFYKENHQIFFKGQKFRTISNFTINLDFKNLNLREEFIDLEFTSIELDYIFNVELKSEFNNLNVNNTKEKILYCPNFSLNSDRFVNVSKGLIIRDVVKFHN
jgi:hypothetical protein